MGRMGRARTPGRDEAPGPAANLDVADDDAADMDVADDVDDDVGDDDEAGDHGPFHDFDAVYAAERDRIVRLAYLLVRSSPVAEDLTQEAFMVLYQQFATVENPPGFLRTVVVRLALRWLRRHDLERRRVAVATGGDDRAAAAPEPPDETWAALGCLSPERRAVVVLRFYEDLDFGRIGELLACSAATARSRTRRALNDLRKELSR